MAKNKQKNGQTFGPKMAKALKVRCDQLEDCVISQQKVIAELESKITNDALGYELKERRYNDAMKFLELNRPEILQLMKANAKHGALAAAGKVPTLTIKVVKRKLKAPKIPEAELLLPEAALQLLSEESQARGEYAPALPKITPQPLEEPDITPPSSPSGPKGSVEVYDFKKKRFVKERKND